LRILFVVYNTLRLDTWNVRSLYRAGSLMAVAKEITEYVIFSGSTRGQMGQSWYQTRRQIYIFSMERGMRIMN
jgi:hypothetical protein